MNTLDKLKSLAGSSPHVADITKFIIDEFAGNESANQKLTSNVLLLNSMQRDSSVKLRDTITGVMIQDDSGVLARQGVLSQTVSELIGLNNKIDIAKLNVEQDAVMANLSQENQYRVAQLKGDLNVEMAGVDGEIDLEIAGVVAASKSEVATKIGDADHDGKVAIENQTSLNNIAIANIKKDNAIRIGAIRGENIVKLATIDAATITKESEIDVAGIKSASDIQVFGIKTERKYDADFITTQANNEKALKDISTIAEKTNIDLMASSDVSLTSVMAQSKKGVIEVSTKTEISSIKALADNEAISTITMANAKAKSTEALGAGKIAAIRADAIIDAGFTKNSANIEASAITSLANAKKSNLLSEASNEVSYLSAKGISHRTAISSDFMLSDSLSKSLSDLEIKNTSTLSKSEIDNSKQASTDKITAMGKENSAQIGFIKDIATIKSTTIKSVADTRYNFVKANADTDYMNKETFFSGVELPNARVISKITTDGDTAYSEARNAKQLVIDGVETAEISKMATDDSSYTSRILGIDVAAINDAKDIDVGAINSAATQRYNFILNQSKMRRDNETQVSENIVIPQIKALSTLKIKEHNDRAGTEKLKYDSLTPEMERVINTERDLRVNSINSDSIARFNNAKGLADTASLRAIQNAVDSANFKQSFDAYMKQLASEASTKKSSIAADIANYSKETKHANLIYKDASKFGAATLSEFNDSGSLFTPESSLPTPPSLNTAINFK
jgi:hypothetical protein